MDSVDSVEGSPETDRARLLSTRFASNSKWREMAMSPMSRWQGVEVNRLGRVAKLDLHGKGIKSTFPQELCQLDAVEELVLHTNRLSGILPATIGDLHRLEKLDLWDNFLEGPIPEALATLKFLRELHLSGNFFRGPIPRALGQLSNLTELYLHGNKLSGKIPPELGGLKRLQKLVLINNKLTGPIPVELAQLKVVVEINLANNRLSGPIPPELGQLSNLTKLYLWGNNLSGSIPEELGRLSLLETLDLAQNILLMSGGGIPLALRKHRNFCRFVFAVPADGAPIPPWISKRSVIPALALGYLDLFSDLFTVLSYYYTGKTWWFAAGLAFIVGPGLYCGLYVLRNEDFSRRLAAVLHLGLLKEALDSFKKESYSEVLVTLRVIAPLYQSLPQLILQTYVLLVNRDLLPLKLFSMVMSALSLAYAITGVVVEHPLSQLKWARGIDYPRARFWRASRLFFGTIPFVGSVTVRGSYRFHPQDIVWWFFLYELLEIFGRVLSLVVLGLVLEYYLVVALAWMWLVRWFVSKASIGQGIEMENLRFRALVRVVGLPFMDSVMDRVKAYKLSCFLTSLETVGCLIVGNAFTDGTALSDYTCRIFSVVALLCLGGKNAFATAIFVPFKEKIGHEVPAVTGELRVAFDHADSSLEESADGESGRRFSSMTDASAGAGAAPKIYEGAGIDAIMTAIEGDPANKHGLRAAGGKSNSNAAGDPDNGDDSVAADTKKSEGGVIIVSGKRRGSRDIAPSRKLHTVEETEVEGMSAEASASTDYMDTSESIGKSSGEGEKGKGKNGLGSGRGGDGETQHQEQQSRQHAVTGIMSSQQQGEEKKLEDGWEFEGTHGIGDCGTSERAPVSRV